MPNAESVRKIFQMAASNNFKQPSSIYPLPLRLFETKMLKGDNPQKVTHGPKSCQKAVVTYMPKLSYFVDQCPKGR